MSYLALYRKFRPAVFDEVRGQDQVIIPLRNQIRTGRFQHAYLFLGTRGTGKTSVAKIFAKAVNCEHPEDGNPCLKCPSCRRIAEGTSMNVIEIDAASNNGVDHVRELIEEVQYRPTGGPYKVYIIDEAHMLSVAAFNALLKTIEEPPEYAIFIFATTVLGKIPVTIQSRCQRYHFRRIDVDEITARLRELVAREGAQAEDRALRFIARSADGSLRDALSLLDRCLTYKMEGELTYGDALEALGEPDASVFAALTNRLVTGDAPGALRTLAEQIASGVDVGSFVTDYVGYLRDLMMVRAAGASEAAEIIDLPEDQLLVLSETAAMTDTDTLMRYIRILSELLARLRYAPNRRVVTEIALLQMAVPRTDRSEEALTGRLSQLERRLEELEERGPAPAVYAEAPRQPEEAAEPGETAEVLPEAAPEDLRRICGDWKRIVNGIREPGIFKTCLLNAVPQFHENLDNCLYIELAGRREDPSIRLFFDRLAEHEAALQRILTEEYGIRVGLEFHRQVDRKPGLKNVDLDKMYDKIHAEVEVEDIPDEEF